jgi:hypothetical protein
MAIWGGGGEVTAIDPWGAHTPTHRTSVPRRSQNPILAAQTPVEPSNQRRHPGHAIRASRVAAASAATIRCACYTAELTLLHCTALHYVRGCVRGCMRAALRCGGMPMCQGSAGSLGVYSSVLRAILIVWGLGVDVFALCLLPLCTNACPLAALLRPGVPPSACMLPVWRMFSYLCGLWGVLRAAAGLCPNDRCLWALAIASMCLQIAVTAVEPSFRERGTILCTLVTVVCGLICALMIGHLACSREGASVPLSSTAHGAGRAAEVDEEKGLLCGSGRGGTGRKGTDAEQQGADERREEDEQEEAKLSLVEQEEAKLSLLRRETAEARRLLAEHDGGDALEAHYERERAASEREDELFVQRARLAHNRALEAIESLAAPTAGAQRALAAMRIQQQSWATEPPGQEEKEHEEEEELEEEEEEVQEWANLQSPLEKSFTASHGPRQASPVQARRVRLSKDKSPQRQLGFTPLKLSSPES